MGKNDYKKDSSGRKQFSIDSIKFHDAENAEEIFGYTRRYQTPPITAVSGAGMSDIPQRSSEDPTAEFVGSFEPDTQSETAEEYSSELSDVGQTKSKPDQKAGDAVLSYGSSGQKNDPYGSWTGRPDQIKHNDPVNPLRKKEKFENPVQDADDL